jgi:hypothetical protein
MEGYDFTYEETANRRKYYRTQVSEVMAKIEGMENDCYAKDMSAGGICLDYSNGLDVGDPVTLTLYDQNDLIASNVYARVAHTADGQTGLYYDNLESYQYDAIYAYVEDAQMSDPQYQEYAKYYETKL